MKNTVDKVSENTKKIRQHLKYLLSTIVKIVKHRRTSGKKTIQSHFDAQFIYLSRAALFFIVFFLFACV